MGGGEIFSRDILFIYAINMQTIRSLFLSRKGFLYHKEPGRNGGLGVIWRTVFV